MKGLFFLPLFLLSCLDLLSQRSTKKRDATNYIRDTCHYIKRGLFDFSGHSPEETRIDSIANAIEMDSALLMKSIVDTGTVLIDNQDIKWSRLLYLVNIEYYFTPAGELKKMVYMPVKENNSCCCPLSVFYYYASNPIKAKVQDYVIISPQDKNGIHCFNSIVYYRKDGEIRTVDKKDKITMKMLDLIFSRFISYRPEKPL